MERVITDQEVETLAFCMGEIDLGMTLYLTQTIMRATAAHKPHLDLLITSGGGQMWAGMSIIDCIKTAQQRGLKVHGRVNGFAGSMAAFILEACDTRAMSPSGQLMLHGWEEGSSGMDKKKRTAQDKSTMNMENQLKTMLLERTKLTVERLDEIMEDSSYKYFTADEALESGLVDEVVW